MKIKTKWEGIKVGGEGPRENRMELIKRKERMKRKRERENGSNWNAPESGE